MEKPEWFKAVDALESAPELVTPSIARARIARITQGFAALGVAAVIAAGGFAVTHLGGSTSATEALSATSASSTTAPTGGTSAPSGSSNAAPTSALAAAPSNVGIGQPVLLGGKPSITGTGAGGESDD